MNPIGPKQCHSRNCYKETEAGEPVSSSSAGLSIHCVRPSYRKTMLANIFEDLKGRKRVGRKRWQSILGQLRFVSIAIPGSAGLFSALQLALNEAQQNRVKVTKHLRRHIHDFAKLAADLCSRPTHLAEIVAEAPSSIGATDAARAGMGGVFFDHEGTPFVWRHPFDDDIQDDLITFENPDGTITNSDLEQAGCRADAAGSN